VNVTRRKLSPVAAAGIGVAIAVILAAAGWFLLVSPQRSNAAELDVEIAAVEEQINAARVAQLQADDLQPIRAADLFRLSKAMPSDIDISGVLLELSRIAKETGITFKSIVPGATASVTGFRVQPIELTFEGDFYSLSDFLYRVRTLVGVNSGRLNAKGRLFTIDKLAFTEGDDGFPQVAAALTVSAYLYGSGPISGAPVAPAPTTTPTDTTATTSTTSTTTTTTDTAATTTTPTPETPAPVESGSAAGTTP
jgi:Pilus assembly protein, PilO